MSPRGWVVALCGSLAAHATALGALAVTLEPDAVADQPLPKTRFSVDAQQVTRRTAAPLPDAGEAAIERAAPAQGAAQGVVPQHTARAADLPQHTARAADLPQHTARAADLSQHTARAVAGPQARLAANAPRPPPSPPQRQTGQRIGAQQPAPAASAASPAPRGRIAQAQVLPSAVRQAAIPQVARTAAALSAPAPALAAAPPLAPPAVDLPLPALSGTAELAWSGAGETPISAASLDAIAAFTQDGDLAAGAREVRDGIAGVLASVPCARLQTTFIPETGALELRGHIPQDAVRAPVLAALRAQVGDAIALSDQLLILPRPQCGALAGIADVGLPQSTEQLTNPRVIGSDGFAQTYSYRDGQRLSLDLQGPDYASYVYVDYFAADGSVIHLQPNEIVPLERAPAKAAMSVGRDRGDKPSLELTVGPPFGQEIAVAFAASVPLYDDPRPLQEPAEPYLAFLKQRVAQARAEHPDFKGEWVYFFISTTAE